jgi:hypothetical protein
MMKINPEMCKFEVKQVFIMLRFSADKNFTVADFCDHAQDVLYNQLGMSGHFRVAPKEAFNLSDKYILGSAKNIETFPRKGNELFVTFLIEETDPDIPLSKELEIFPVELKGFCDSFGFSVEQVDILSMY